MLLKRKRLAIAPLLLWPAIGLARLAPEAASPAGLSAPATQPESPAAAFAAEQRDALREMLQSAPATPERPVDQLLRFDIVNGHLVIDLLDVDGPERRAFLVNGDRDNVFTLDIITAGTTPPMKLLHAHALRYEAKANRSFDIDLQPIPGRASLSLAIQMPTVTTTVQLLDQGSGSPDGESMEGVARLYLQRSGEESTSTDAADEGRFNFTEASFAEIVEKHHDDALALLGEGLTSLRAMHVMAGVGRDEAKAIFDANREVDAATMRELERIVESVRQDGSAAVAEARPKLRKLGSSAAMALTRLPRDGWSPDLALNVDTLAAGLLPTANDRAAALLNSPSRLIDLLYSPDTAIRREAKERLAKLTKRPVELDVAADPYTKVAEIEAIRSATAEPTTRTARE